MSVTHATRVASKLNPKQVDLISGADFQIAGFVLAADAASSDVSTALTTWAATGGRNGSSVPVQVATALDVQGFAVGADGGYVQINDSATGDRPKDGNDDEIYGELTEAAGVYTVTYYVGPTATRSAVNLPAGTYDLIFGYRFELHRLPVDFARGLGRIQLAQDAANAGIPQIEAINPTALNTVPALSAAPRAGSERLHVNGQEFVVSQWPGITIAGTALTWDAAQMGFDLETTDRVTILYYS